MTGQTLELIHTPNYQQIKQSFYQELLLARDGKPSSISFIKHHLSKKPVVTNGHIQGIVIGGTNYLIATEILSANETKKITRKSSGKLPELSNRKILADFFKKHLAPQAQAIGINFGFPLNPVVGSFGELDGILRYGTKEHTFTGLHESIGELVKSLTQNKIKVSVANDTVCLSLSGNGTENGAIVAGTGFNMCLVLQNEKDRKLINMESGNFNNFTPSPILQKIDAESEVPGGQLFEKAISGKYLALYFNEKVKERNLSIPLISTSQELSELSHGNHAGVAGDLARAIITRSAYLVGAAIAGVYEFYERPQTFTLIGEGSLLWEGWQYLENINKQLIKLGIPQGTVKIIHVKDSSINGAFSLLAR
jgi:hexokinase